jgi:hypothetical protein
MQVLGDMFSAITAAIYLDSELDIEIVWKVRFNPHDPLLYNSGVFYIYNIK